jgi:fatty acid desaturase
MRLWLKDSERRPDPAPVKTDDRKAVLVGLVLWLIALGALLLFLAPLLADGRQWWLWTAVVGLGVGLILLVVTHRRRHIR